MSSLATPVLLALVFAPLALLVLAAGEPRFLAPPGVRLASPCATLGVLLPPLSLPLLYVVSLGCEAWMTHDDFSSGELVPTLLGALVWCCVACMLAGIPLAIAGAVRRERPVRLLLLGPITSIAVFGYLQAVQWLAVTIARS